MDDFYKKLGQLIKDKRLEKDLTTQELADTLGVSIGFLSNLENGRTDTFNVTLMLNLHNNLGMPLLNFLPISNNDLCSSNLSSSKRLNDESNIEKVISKNINNIINAYMTSIKSHNYEPVFIDKITEKLINELKYIENFKLK